MHRNGVIKLGFGGAQGHSNGNGLDDLWRVIAQHVHTHHFVRSVVYQDLDVSLGGAACKGHFHGPELRLVHAQLGVLLGGLLFGEAHTGQRRHGEGGCGH